MTELSYDYSKRQGILPVSWEDFHGLCKALALAASKHDPEIILPVGRGGFYPGALIAHMLQVDPYPVRLTRRVQDKIVWDSPHWLVEPPRTVAGKRVLVVDEISSSGDTLHLVREKATEMDAGDVRCAVLYAHSWGVEIPDYIGIITDALVLNPWDREIIRDGQFVFHPEYSSALSDQGIEADYKLCIPTHTYSLAKEPGPGNQ